MKVWVVARVGVGDVVVVQVHGVYGTQWSALKAYDLLRAKRDSCIVQELEVQP